MAQSDDLTSLARSLRRLEDIEAIKTLMNRYAEAADPTFKAAEMVALFDEDIALDLGPFGRHEGRESVYKFLKDFEEKKVFSWIFHCYVPLAIDVAEDGHTARGKWHLLQLLTMEPIGDMPRQAIWIAGKYDNRLRKTDGVWKFFAVHHNVQIMTPHKEGWVETPMLFSLA